MRLCFQKWKRGCGPVVDTLIHRGKAMGSVHRAVVQCWNFYPQGQGRGFKSLPQKQNKTTNQITKTNKQQTETTRSLSIFGCPTKCCSYSPTGPGLTGKLFFPWGLREGSFVCGVLLFRTLQFGVKRVRQKGEREGVLLLHNAGLCPIGKMSFSIWVWHVSCPHPFQVHVMCLNNWS